MRVAVVTAVLGLATSAFAEPPGLVPPMESKVLGEKNETLATGLTLAGIALPAALAWEALNDPYDDGGEGAMALLLTIPAPAIGHWYTNHVGTYGMLARTAGSVLFGVGLSDLQGAARCASGQIRDSYYCSNKSRSDGRIELTAGIGIYAASWIYDLVTARSEVRRYNRARTVFIAPAVTATMGGLTVAGRF